jgi:hypothetical protein
MFTPVDVPEPTTVVFFLGVLAIMTFSSRKHLWSR